MMRITVQELFNENTFFIRFKNSVGNLVALTKAGYTKDGYVLMAAYIYVYPFKKVFTTTKPKS